MKFFRVSEEAKEIWPNDGQSPDWSGALTRVVGEALAPSRPRTPAEEFKKALKAITNPRGRAILSLLIELGEASASELADSLSMHLHTVAYQIRSPLSNAGLIELCDTDIRRGGLMKIYRPSPPEWARLLLEAERAAIAAA